MSEVVSFTWNDFSAGELGMLNPEKFQTGFYNGANVMVSEEGWVYPRPGLVDITPSGVPSGRITGMGLGFGTRGLWYFVGKHGYAFDPNGAFGNASIGSLAADPTRPLASNGRYITNYGDKTYEWNGTTLSSLTGSPGGYDVCEWNGFVVVGGASGTPNRLQFSSQYNASSWPALNYIDVGTIGQITALVPLRDRIIVAFGDGSWWSFTGDPENADAQRVSQLTNIRKAGPSSWVSTVGFSSNSVTTNLSGLILTGPNVGFDGANFVNLIDRPLAQWSYGVPYSGDMYFDVAGNAKTTGATRAATESSVGLANIASTIRGSGHTVQVASTSGGGSMLVSVRRGVPSIHWVRYSLAGVAVDFPGCVFLTTGGAGSNGSTTSARFFRWDADKGFDAGNKSGDDTTSPLYGYFTTPQLAMPDGKTMVLHSVDVETVGAGNPLSGDTRSVQLTITPDGYGESIELVRGGSRSSVNKTASASGDSTYFNGVTKFYPPQSAGSSLGQFSRVRFSLRIANVAVKSIRVHFTALPARS